MGIINKLLALCKISKLRSKDYTERKQFLSILEEIGWRPWNNKYGAWFWIAKEDAEQCAKISTLAIKPLIEDLFLGSSDMRCFAHEALAKIGTPAFEPLISHLDLTHKHELNVWLIDVLGEIGDVRAVDPLIIGLKHNLKEIRKRAAKALGKIEDPKVLELLVNGLKNDLTYESARIIIDNSVKHNHPLNKDFAIECYIAAHQWEKVVQVGAPAVEPLISHFKNMSDPISKGALIGALGEIGDIQAIKQLLVIQKQYDKAVRRDAKKALEKIGDNPQAFELLIEILKASNLKSNLTYEVANIVIDISEKNKLPLNEEFAIQCYIAAHQWEKVIQVGAPAVGHLIYHLKDKDRNVVGRIIRVLGKIGDYRAFKPLSAIANTHSELSFSATLAIRDLGASSFESLITSLKSSTNTFERCSACDALGESGDVRGVGPLINALRDNEKYLRRAAAKALGKIGDLQAVEPLIIALKDKDDETRENAAEALGNIGDQKAVIPLISVIEDSYKGECLMSRWEGIPPEKRPVRLRYDLEFGDREVRIEAIIALGKIGDPRAIETIKLASEEKIFGITKNESEGRQVRREALKALEIIRKSSSK